MKVHTQAFKDNVCLFGRELDSKITYTLNNEDIELGAEELNSVSPHYEGGILKSVMRQLDIDSNVDIPLETILNYQFGVKIGEDVETGSNVYEYVDFGDYIVYKSEKQEDTNSYKITCYDKMLYSMKDYENMNITYPITIRNYINTICNYLGLTFKNINDTFANYNKQINAELYLDSEGNSLGYTFRDVLDELAQVTASTICINENDNELEIRYINETNDIINEEYLKDINVNFGEQYGPVNTIVLSRSGKDKIYMSYPEDLPDENKIAIEISDNQIMNFNDRDTYLSDILSRLNGLQYYLNDFVSTGITYFNLCDRYRVQIGEELYSCVMFNDEIEVTQGLKENIYTDMPEEAKTDYTKADKTDRRINQTYSIVDKQNGIIENVVTNVTEQNNKISQITQTVDEINSKISDIADITTSGESMIARVPLTDVNASQPISIKIYPIGENISYLYPYNGLYPSDTLYMKSRTLLFTNTTTHETFPWELPTDLWYYDSTTYDELELSYGDGTNSNVIVTRRCQINADGTTSVLATPTTERYAYPSDLVLTDGDYSVELLGYNTGYLYVQLMAKNIYTTQFYTKAETNSVINQKADEINLGVTQTLSNYSTTNQMNSAIDLKANEITSTVSETYATKTTTNQLSTRIGQTAKGISLTVNNGSTSSGIIIGITKENGTTEQTSGTIQMNGLVKFTDLSGSGSTTINGSNITTGTIDASKVTVKNLNANNITSGTISGSKINGGTINGNNVTISNLNASNITSGTLSADKISGGTINASNIAVTNITASNINRGSLTGANIDINNGTGFLRMLSGSAYNPYVSALNVSNKSNGISFRNSNTSGNAGSQIGTLHTENTNLVMDATGNILIGGSSMSSGAIGIWSGYIHAGNLNIGQNYINNSNGGQIAINQSISLNTANGGYAYVDGLYANNRILTVGGSPSTLSVKESIEKKDISDIPKILRQIDLYDYKYKKEIEDGKEDYGYIIDYLEKIPNIEKYFEFYDAEKNGIKYKQISHEQIEKFLLGSVIELQRQLDEMKEMVYNLKEKESDK